MSGGRALKKLSVAILVTVTVGTPAAIAVGCGKPVATSPDPSLADTVERVGFDRSVVQALVAGQAAVRGIDGSTGSELAACGLVLIPARMEAVSTICRDISFLSLLVGDRAVTSVAKFSTPPTVSDLDSLELPARDAEYLTNAKAGRSDIKLSRQEIVAIRNQSPQQATLALKKALVARTTAWRLSGVNGLGSYSDKKETVRQADVLASMTTRHNDVVAPVEYRPSEALQYWSVLKIDDCKPILQVISASVYESQDSTRIDFVQLYASHYCDGLLLSVDLLPVLSPDGPATLMRLLVRARVDMLGGVLGGIKRRIARSKAVEFLAHSLEQVRSRGSWPVDPIGDVHRRVPASDER